MYKDKDKQRDANRKAQAKFKAKGITEGITDRVLPQFEDIIGLHLKGVPKRGKDIKCFVDLPPDVQQTISRMSLVNGKIDQFDKAKRTTAAIKYQHLFPESFEPNHFIDVSNIVTGKPGDQAHTTWHNGICTEEWRQARGR